jgi:hypothetical protein
MPTKFSPMDISSQLDSPETIAGYLRECLKDKDPRVVRGAVEHAVMALDRLADSKAKLTRPGAARPGVR